MTIHCNAGTRTTKMMGTLKNYGDIWFDKDFIANILSLARVKEKFSVTFDSTNDNAFILHKPNGTKLLFKESSPGLYFHDRTNRAILFAQQEESDTEPATSDAIETVSSNAAMFSTR